VGQPPPEKSGELKLDERPWKARTGAIEEKPHAQCFGALYCDQSHVPADVIQVGEVRNDCFIGFCIAFKFRDSAFDALTKARTDFEAFIGGAVQYHGRLLG
jgi:hypothetical protein